jgi:hypothetical protein
MNENTDAIEGWEEDPIDYAELQAMVGKKYVFEDGDSIEIVQIKRRDTGPWVTYHVQQGPGIPRKLLMMLDEFHITYGHLF